MAKQGESSEKIVLYNTISYDMTLSDRAPPLLPMPLLRLKARQSQCHSDKGLGKACLSSNRATLYVLWELSNVSVSTGTLLNQDKTDGKTKKKKRKGKDQDHHHLNFHSKETLRLQMSYDDSFRWTPAILFPICFDKWRASWPSGTWKGKTIFTREMPGSQWILYFLGVGGSLSSQS